MLALNLRATDASKMNVFTEINESLLTANKIKNVCNDIQ